MKIELTEEDDLDEITRILLDERSTKDIFRFAQENAEKRLAELKITGDAWWGRFMLRHGLEQTVETPQYRIVHGAGGIYVEAVRYNRVGKTDDGLLDALFELIARKKK